PPRRRCHVPGAGRGASAPLDDAGDPLARRLLPGPPREDDGRVPRRRAHRCRQRPRRGGQEARRHAEDGGVQPGLRPLPLLTERAGVDDTAAMRAAISAAATVRTSTAPNPWVGAVVASGDGSILATGATQPPGGPHAERV